MMWRMINHSQLAVPPHAPALVPKKYTKLTFLSVSNYVDTILQGPCLSYPPVEPHLVWVMPHHCPAPVLTMSHLTHAHVFKINKSSKLYEYISDLISVHIAM